MRISLVDIPDLISILFSTAVIVLAVMGTTSPSVISTGVLAVLIARIVGFWSSRAATRLSSLERSALQMVREERERSFDECEAKLHALAGKVTGADVLKSLIDKRAVKIARRNGSKCEKGQCGASV